MYNLLRGTKGMEIGGVPGFIQSWVENQTLSFLSRSAKRNLMAEETGDSQLWRDYIFSNSLYPDLSELKLEVGLLLPVYTFPLSLIDGLTLPAELGGYEIMAHKVCQEIIFDDVTMHVSEMGLDTGIPTGHPNPEKFETARPYLDNQYDLIFCGRVVNKEQPKEEYRRESEWSQLAISQLVFALDRLKPGGHYSWRLRGPYGKFNLTHSVRHHL